jgi:hypothetical protein
MARLFILLTMLCWPVLSTAADAEPFGRLFFTPEERAIRDQARLNSRSPLFNNTEAGITAGIPERITLEGYARRSNGQATAWISRTPRDALEKPPAISPQAIAHTGRPSQPMAVSVQRADGKKIALRVGQTFDRTSNAIREDYQQAPESALQVAATK